MGSEEKVKEHLENCGLRVERYSKEELKKIKTPDFKVYSDDELVFYCEVKESEEDTWLDKKLEEAGPGVIVGGERNDPVYNRLTTHIHKATKQFESVNSDRVLPNVLAFYNSDDGYGFNDLLAVVTGNFYSDDGSVHKIYTKYSEGRVKEDLKKIDLIIWLDKFKPFRYFFISGDKDVDTKLSGYLNYNYSSTNCL